MFGLSRASALVSILLLALAACSDGAIEPSFVSEAQAAPAGAPGQTWRVEIAPNAEEDRSFEYY